MLPYRRAHNAQAIGAAPHPGAQEAMKIRPAPHAWAVTPAKAMDIQTQLAGRVLQIAPHTLLRLVAGVDAAFSRDDRRCAAAVVLWDVETRTVVEQHVAAGPLRFPYIPGLLSFREVPTVLAALRKLRTPPDVLLYDGHGRAHPRRFGVACHVGVLTDLPAIGCAKSRLIGSHDAPGIARGSTAPLIDSGDVIGSVVRTQDRINPVFVSIGHRMDLQTAEAIVLACATRYRLPEPIRLADHLVRTCVRSR